MQVSSDILFGILGKNNSLLYKTRYAQFTNDPFSANNRHSRQNFGLIADGPRVGMSVSTAPVAKGKSSLRMQVHTKNTRRTVNAAPRLDRSGKDNKNFKAGRALKNYNFAVENVHDKNVANKYGDRCPMVRRRIGKLHRANCRAAPRTNATA